MDIYKAIATARELMDRHGLTDRGWTLKLDRAKTRNGRCSYTTRTIQLSQPLIKSRAEEDVINTILHEIAHALTGPGHGHDAVWRRQHIAIGGNGKRCTGGEGVSGRYVGTCPKGHKRTRHRMSKAITVGASCGVCDSRFNPNYLLVWIDTTTGAKVRS